MNVIAEVITHAVEILFRYEGVLIQPDLIVFADHNALPDPFVEHRSWANVLAHLRHQLLESWRLIAALEGQCTGVTLGIQVLR